MESHENSIFFKNAQEMAKEKNMHIWCFVRRH